MPISTMRSLAVSDVERRQLISSPQTTQTLKGFRTGHYGARPSVSSILVPHGSVMNATRILLEKLLGVSP